MRCSLLNAQADIAIEVSAKLLAIAADRTVTVGRIVDVLATIAIMPVFSGGEVCIVFGFIDGGVARTIDDAFERRIAAYMLLRTAPTSTILPPAKFLQRPQQVCSGMGPHSLLRPNF